MTLPEFGPGTVRLLWVNNSYDGMSAAVGILEERQPVYLAAFEYGRWALRAEWITLESQLEKLVDEDDFENIWDRLERKYTSVMHEGKDRCFNVHELPPDEFERLVVEHRQWLLHAGLSGTYWYDDEGIPRLIRDYWEVPRSYLDAHYYAKVPWRERGDRLTAYPVLGTITRSVLNTTSELRVPKPKDPRSDALKAYQQCWRPDDLVQTEW